MVNKEQLFNGIVKYMDSEIIPVLSTGGKWAIGAVVTILSTKYENVVNNLSTNTLVKSLGVIDENGMIDDKMLIEALKVSAEKYGTLQMNIPLIGTFGFKADDVDKLGKYIDADKYVR